MDHFTVETRAPLDDKQQHAWVGRAFGEWTHRDNRTSAYAGAVILSLAKEAADARDPVRHDADPFDAASTVLGAIAGYEGWPIAPVVGRDGVAILVRLTW